MIISQRTPEHLGELLHRMIWKNSQNEVCMCQKYKYIIPEIPPSNNKFIGRNTRWQYQAEKKRWAEMIAWLCRPKPPTPIPKAQVTLDYYFGNRIRHDPDNYSGKMVLDGLVKAGIIQDDSFSCIRLRLNGKYDKSSPRLEITVEELEK
ncbi:RusA family crossover junction endodeoxyribonuclease [Massilioclostridium coli]|uniref:RusA family crossover junction endodeoxyribonuclease n=1 Tax=Massilioclostridium coli TaxID=1870991 RepID=UPI003A598EB3